MIKLHLGRQAGYLNRFVAEGHAGYAAPGEVDLICAAVTALTTGIIGALQDEVQVPLTYQAEDGLITCEVDLTSLNQTQQEAVDLLLRTLCCAAKQIQMSYGDEYLTVSTD